jgi:hypothetical protein
MKTFALIAATIAMTLGGCGNDPESFASARMVQGLVKEKTASARGAAAAPSPKLTRAVLSQVLTPVMLVNLESRAQQALIGQVETNGDVETWSTVDDVSISFRHGVVVATRGLGPDLMAAAGPSGGQLLSSGSTFTRVHTTLNGLDQPIKRQLACTTSNQGTQTIDIVEVAFKATHIVETCDTGNGSIQNDYWIDSAGKIRKSRQWIGQEIGFLVIEDLRR